MAERNTLMEVKIITDDSTGMYRIGEIDTLTDARVIEYVKSYGEVAYEEIKEFCAKLTSTARVEIMAQRMKNMQSTTQCSSAKN